MNINSRASHVGDIEIFSSSFLCYGQVSILVHDQIMKSSKTHKQVHNVHMLTNWSDRPVLSDYTLFSR